MLAKQYYKKIENAFPIVHVIIARRDWHTVDGRTAEVRLNTFYSPSPRRPLTYSLTLCSRFLNLKKLQTNKLSIHHTNRNRCSVPTVKL